MSPSIEKTPSVTISAAAPAACAQPPGEVLECRRAGRRRSRPGEPAAVDDAGVVELVGEDDLAAPARPRRPDVREVAGAEEQRRLGALELREPPLELVVGSMVPEIRRDAPAPAPQRSPPRRGARTPGSSARPR